MAMSYVRQMQQSQPNKRRRHDDANVYTSPNGYSRHISTKHANLEDEGKIGELRVEGSESLYLDLSTLPTSALHRYMTNHRLAEQLPPKPKDATGAVVLPFALRPALRRQSVEDVPEPPQPPPEPEETNEEGSEEGGSSMKRRTSRKSWRSASIGAPSAQPDNDDEMLDPEDMEEEAILPDVDEAHQLCNDIVSSHYREQNVKEVESVVNFVHALRSKSGWKACESDKELTISQTKRLRCFRGVEDLSHHHSTTPTESSK
ncbi:hypothetical protein E3P99_03291 [Wallemia hederae]|uniref:Histone deacetylase complex subunit SAP30 Sin3 binding domain-containing protein n=1 Tax=Wallemia hederae TaxID=1540922 RepID=A0A4T0FFX6_9BASI|nr:hypothetical protein E3P99_03291 [Wallemia hederae]